ncbi:gamma carbonic anhydrase family protein [Jiangella mangrovi]|uniref:Carbonic anhydrase/acetyltransferase-like protein (Isoleucine patch superfamily) n=1 Tax=Jiangella mangrovi TaxID=1524084 RepID=A0A7W9GUE9_9ACTN|nr:gamma carbonic anhydrase family protein [Jiangella mangrovi]MBB5790235.1 carbonic anhydrase/acetyltransferase-like protein (isoleucine patch superfamily) [Jiangella mangrovi]
MLIEHDGIRPEVDPSAYVAPMAVLSGDVHIGPGCRILFGAVLTADGGPVRLAANCVVMENAVLRGRAGHPLTLGENVLVGPHSHLNGATVDDDVFLATGVSVFPGARIESGAEVRINAVVHVNTRVPAGATVPIGWIAVGDPAELFPPSAHDEYWPKLKALDFPGTVFGVPREELTMGRIAAAYGEVFGRHTGDTVLE